MTSFALKIVAILTMTLDHTGSIIGQAGFMVMFPDAALYITAGLRSFLRFAGRAAFPLFAFMLAEGCAKTRSMPRYLGRLALFAVISEPFYYFAFSFDPGFAGLLDSLAGFNLTNVFFTLFLGASSVFLCQKMAQKYEEKSLIISLIATLALAVAAEYLGTDYGAMGVLLIAALYLTRGKRAYQCAVIALWAFALYPGGALMATSVVNVDYNVLEALGACLACVPILLYNGKRGRRMKWTFYVYYPAHLLVLTLINRALLG